MNETGNKTYISAEAVPTGWTYFVQASGAIKIGFSARPTKRLMTLQSSNGGRLKVLAVVPGSTVSEWDAHRRFAHLRIRGEWFKPAPDLMAFIRDLRGGASADMSRGSRELDATRQALIAKRAKCGAHSPIGRRLSLLVQQLENGISPVRTIAEINQIQRDGGQYIHANHCSA